jgi:hypothetical protein
VKCAPVRYNRAVKRSASHDPVSEFVHAMIEVNETIEVASDPKTVWALLSDPRAVVECVSGATLGEQQEDGTYDAGITVKFGPAKVAFRAKVQIEYDQPTMSGKSRSAKAAREAPRSTFRLSSKSADGLRR